MKTRLPFAFAALAVLPFIMTGCSGSGDKNGASAESKPAAEAPAKSCAKLEKSLNELGTSIRNVDASLARLAGDAVTDPTERNEVFVRSLKKVNTAPVKASVDDVLRITDELMHAWDNTAASLTDAGAKVAAEANRADVKARREEFLAALRELDSSIAAHKKLLGQVRVVLTNTPGPDQIRNARPLVRRLSDLGTRVGVAVNNAISATNRLGRLPVPVVVEPAEEAKPMTPEPAKVENSSAAPAAQPTPAATPPAPAAPVVSSDAPAPVAPTAGVKTESASVLATPPAPAAEAKPAPAPEAKPETAPAPNSAPAVKDPVPEPVEA